MSREEEEVEGEDERKEAAIASTPSLQPGFKPTRVSQEQVFKLQVRPHYPNTYYIHINYTNYKFAKFNYYFVV